MVFWVILAASFALSNAASCGFNQAAPRPDAITCNSATSASMGKNTKVNDKHGPFESIMDLDMTNFTGTLDETTLSMYPNLKTLTIQNSNFPKISSSMFEKCCKGLKKLSVRGNMETIIEPGSFKDLKQLEELNINNKITKLSKDLLEGLVTLRTLTLKKTKIDEIDENVFEDLKTLENLEIYDNTFSQIKPKTFIPLIELKKLSILHNSNLKEFSLDLLKSQQKLEHLGLPAKILNEVDISILKTHFPGLKKLEVPVDDKDNYENFLEKAKKEHLTVNFIDA